MGEGGYITLVNGTPFQWVKTAEHSYQMNAWNFPSTINPGDAAQVYVEWTQTIGKKQSDDGAETMYTLQGTKVSNSFEIQARNTNGFQLLAYYGGLSAPGFPQGSSDSLGWIHDGSVNFILSGEPDRFGFWTIHSPTNWMQRSYSQIANLSLKYLTIPGSHDAGMSTLKSGTAVIPCNVLTQTYDVGQQLAFGMRYIDVRPVISDGQYLTGHYSNTGGALGWQGGNGQSIDDIVAQINAYTANNKELIIIDISHDLNTDVGRDYRSFTSGEYATLIQKLQGIKDLVTGLHYNENLMVYSIARFIGPSQAGVIVLLESDTPDFASLDGKGFFTLGAYNYTGSYADKPDVSSMISDQHTKLKADGAPPQNLYDYNQGRPFLLSWDLTQGTKEVATCFADSSKSIRGMADTAYPWIFKDILPFSKANNVRPNVLQIDNVKDSDLVSLSMAYNTLFRPAGY